MANIVAIPKNRIIGDIDIDVVPPNSIDKVVVNSNSYTFGVNEAGKESFQAYDTKTYVAKNEDRNKFLMGTTSSQALTSPWRVTNAGPVTFQIQLDKNSLPRVFLDSVKFFFRIRYSILTHNYETNSSGNVTVDAETTTSATADISLENTSTTFTATDGIFFRVQSWSRVGDMLTVTIFMGFHKQYSSGLTHPITREYVYLQDVNVSVRAQMYIGTPFTQEYTENLAINEKADILTIENPIINPISKYSGESSVSVIGSTLYNVYKRGRIYGTVRVMYGSYNSVFNTSVLNGTDGGLIGVGTYIRFIDHLPYLTFVVTSSEFDGSLGIVTLKFTAVMDTKYIYVIGSGNLALGITAVPIISGANTNYKRIGILNPTSLIVDNDYVYVVTNNITIRKYIKNTTTQVAVASPFSGNILGITSDSNYIYVVGNYTGTYVIRILSKSNLATISTSPIGAIPGVPTFLINDNMNVYVFGNFNYYIGFDKTDLGSYFVSNTWGSGINAVDAVCQDSFLVLTSDRRVHVFSGIVGLLIASMPINYICYPSKIFAEGDTFYLAGTNPGGTYGVVQKGSISGLSYGSYDSRAGIPGGFKHMLVQDNYIYVTSPTNAIMYRFKKSNLTSITFAKLDTAITDIKIGT